MPREESLYPGDWLHIRDSSFRYAPFRMTSGRNILFPIKSFIERYPFITESGLTEEDIRESQDQIKELVKILRAEI